LVVPSHGAVAPSKKGESTVKTFTPILAAGAILAFAAQAGTAANVKHAKKGELARHSAIKVGYGPYAYLGNKAPASASGAGYQPYSYLRDFRIRP
jgi:hypothetical protein